MNAIKLLLLCLFLNVNLFAQVPTDSLIVKKGQIIVFKQDSLILDYFCMEDSSILQLQDINSFAIISKKSSIGKGCKIFAQGKNGKRGIDGRKGDNAQSDCRNGLPGGHGSSGEDGVNGINIFLSSSFNFIGSLYIYSDGGNGGSGGNGGNGGNGGKGDISRDCRGGNGGQGGNGGNAGRGGNGGRIEILAIKSGIIPRLNPEDTLENKIIVSYSSGENGRVGRAGKGGDGGPPVSQHTLGLKISKGGGEVGPRGKDGDLPPFGKEGSLDFGTIEYENPQYLGVPTLIPESILSNITADKQTTYSALIFYNENYENKDINDLTVRMFEDFGPRKSAKRLQKVLSEYYYFNGGIEIYDDLGKSELNRRIIDKLSMMKENDNLLIFYTGHGYYDTLRQQTFWMPVDAGLWPYYDKYYNTADLITELRVCKAINIFVIADACYGGGLFQETMDPFQDMPADTRQIYQRKSRVALTSGNIEPVPKKSAFAKYFIDYLEDNGKNKTEKYLTATKIYVDIRGPIIRNTEPEPHSGIIPYPAFGYIKNTGDRKGDFILIRKDDK